MPIYEFICQSCGNEFEQIQSFSDSTVPACAKCGSSEVVRRMGRPAIHFKGSGWYVTDSKSKGDKKNGANGAVSTSSEDTASKEAVTESKGESSSDKAETKVEPKTDSKSAASTDSKSTPAPVASD